jgi:mRNA interferase YafQ
MFAPAYTRQFARDLKRLRRGGHALADLKAVMASLLAGERLEPKYKDHKLIGSWQGRRECHIRPDWLLIYKIDKGKRIIIFERQEVTRTCSANSFPFPFYYLEQQIITSRGVPGHGLPYPYVTRT